MAPPPQVFSARGRPRDFTAHLGDDSTLDRGARSRCAAAKVGSGVAYAWNSDANDEGAACSEKTELPHMLSGISEEDVSQKRRGQASPVRSSVRSPLRKRPQQLLDAVLRRIIPCTPSAPSAPASPAKLKAAPKNIAADDEVQLAAFRKFLAKAHGNITRAFRVMKTTSARSVGTGSRSEKNMNSNQLSAAEFEWCVIAQLKYGDRRLAKQLFKSLDRDRKGAIGLCELVKEGSQTACSLVEFRRLLLDRYPSLATAFRELEEYLAAKHPDRCVKNRCMNLAEFIEASAFFGMGAQQAVHMFQVLDIDGNGDLTLQEFMESLTNVPRQVLLQDFRKRLLSRYSSIQCAFHKVMRSAGDNVRMRCPEFVSALVAIGVGDLEAAELFRLIDSDGSGDVSFLELLNALRECAPDVDLETFWQRFAHEWPEFNVASARRSSGLIEARREFACLVTALTCGDVPKRATSTISYEAFDDAISVRLDISRGNSAELFQQILTSTKHGPEQALEAASMTLPHEATRDAPSSDQGESVATPDGWEIYLDDFLEQLHLWTLAPIEAVGGSAVKKGVLDGMVRPLRAAKAAIRSLKTDLQSLSSKDSEVLAAGGFSGTGQRKRKKMIKPPWSTRPAPMAFNQVVFLS